MKWRRLRRKKESGRGDRQSRRRMRGGEDNAGSKFSGCVVRGLALRRFTPSPTRGLCSIFERSSFSVAALPPVSVWHLAPRVIVFLN